MLGFLFQLLQAFGLFYFTLAFASFDTTLFGFTFASTVSFDSIRFTCFDLVSSIAESPTSMISSFQSFTIHSHSHLLDSSLWGQQTIINHYHHLLFSFS